MRKHIFIKISFAMFSLLSLIGCIAVRTISINSKPQGAEIWVDGVNTGKTTPAEINVTISRLTKYVEIMLKKEGYLPVLEGIRIANQPPYTGKATIIPPRYGLIPFIYIDIGILSPGHPPLQILAELVLNGVILAMNAPLTPIGQAFDLAPSTTEKAKIFSNLECLDDLYKEEGLFLIVYGRKASKKYFSEIFIEIKGEKRPVSASYRPEEWFVSLPEGEYEIKIVVSGFKPYYTKIKLPYKRVTVMEVNLLKLEKE